jgi:Na+-translocating ferredoxin:NAD+ oxidoreductase RnfD subunit
MYDVRKQIEARCSVVGAEEFYTHLIMFVCVTVLALAAGTMTGTLLPIIPPLLGWAIGLIGHAIAVFMPQHWFGREWEERKIQERLDKT